MLPDPMRLVPEMDESADIAEITTACWRLGQEPLPISYVRHQPNGRPPQAGAKPPRVAAY
jgi:hypothetical protein